MQPRRALVLGLLLIGLVAMPVASPVLAQSAGNNTTTTAAPTTTAGTTTTTSPATTSTTGSGDSGLASLARITPVEQDEPYLSINVHQRDAVFNTSGPFAQFGVSEQVEAVRISQPKASAEVLTGGHQVVVRYEDDAAAPSQSSLYVLELFFADGSTTQVELYATQTDVSVKAAELAAFENFIDETCEDATDEGFECSPAGLEEYVGWLQWKGQVIDRWLGDSAKQLFGIAFAASRNPLFWLLVLLGLASVGYYTQSKYGRFLTALRNDPGLPERRADELRAQAREQFQSAHETPLSKILGSDAMYWEDAYGVDSPAALANLAARGMHVRGDDGELRQHHAGVADLSAGDIQQSWLEAVVTETRIPNPTQALEQIRKTLTYMEAEHGAGHLYRDATRQVNDLLGELDRSSGAVYSRGTGPADAGGASADD